MSGSIPAAHFLLYISTVNFYPMLRFFLLLSLIFAGFSLVAQRVEIYPDQVVQCYYYGTSEPIRDKVLMAPKDAKKMYPGGEVPNNFIKRKYRFENGKAPASIDPVAQLINGTKQMQQGPILNFEGMNRFNSGGAIPPDCSGDVGPNHYVQMVNLAFINRVIPFTGQWRIMSFSMVGMMVRTGIIQTTETLLCSMMIRLIDGL